MSYIYRDVYTERQRDREKSEGSKAEKKSVTKTNEISVRDVLKDGKGKGKIRAGVREGRRRGSGAHLEEFEGLGLQGLRGQGGERGTQAVFAKAQHWMLPQLRVCVR